MQNRIYVVMNDSGDPFLVRATSQAQALRHIAGRHYSVRIAKTTEIVDLMSKGTKVEDAKSEGDAE